MELDWTTSLWIILGAFSTLPIALIIFLATAPKTYDPYNPDLIEEDRETEKENDPAPGEGYGHFSKIRDTNKTIRNECPVLVVVLGDIGRSPRMQYHAISLAKHGAKVELVGYVESDIHPTLLASKNVTVHALPPPPLILRSGGTLLLPLKALWQALQLYHTLGYRTRPTKWTLLQNPPAIPTLLITLVISYLRNSRLVIDWHNTGFSILALRLRPTHPLVRLAKFYELTLAPLATSHLAVSAAMARYLRRAAGLPAAGPRAPLVLHDRPAELFRPLAGARERLDFLKRCPQTDEFAEEIVSGKRRLLVSSTSWTADEDFSLLLKALQSYSSAAGKPASHLPPVLLVITGKGPQRAAYEMQIAKLAKEKKLEHAPVRTAFLPLTDYAALLASADLGISLHTSSSGVDLPMKVVDMQGAGLPVAGWGAFEAWGELVEEGVDGLGFASAEELETVLQRILGNQGKMLQTLRKGAAIKGSKRWDEEWDAVAGRLFKLVS